MTLRTKRETITFAHPFTLRGVDGAQPAGAYTIETHEEPIEDLSFLAYRRIATVIFLPVAHGGAGSFQAVAVDPRALDAAMACEATVSGAARSGNQRPGTIISIPCVLATDRNESK